MWNLFPFLSLFLFFPSELYNLPCIYLVDILSDLYISISILGVANINDIVF